MNKGSGFQVADDAAELYQEVLVPAWFEPWARALLEVAPVGPGERVLDLACGTGVVARLAARAAGEDGVVAGLDINAPMLEIARTLPSIGGAKLEWLERDAGATGLDDASYDLVLVQHGYHYFPDKPGVLAEIRRILRPGGRLAMSVWVGHSPYTQALCATLERLVSQEIAAQQRNQRETPSAKALIEHLEVAGFEDVEIVESRLNIQVPPAVEFVAQHIGSMPVAAAFGALPPKEQRAFVAQMESAMSPWATTEGLAYPDAVNVVLGKKPRSE